MDESRWIVAAVVGLAGLFLLIRILRTGKGPC